MFHQVHAPLSKKFESTGMVTIGNYQDRQGDWQPSLEIVGACDDRFHEHAEVTIIAMLGILEVPPQLERNMFEYCEVREFNTAYDLGVAPVCFNDGLSAKTILRMALPDASLRITL